MAFKNNLINYKPEEGTTIYTATAVITSIATVISYTLVMNYANYYLEFRATYYITTVTPPLLLTHFDIFSKGAPNNTKKMLAPNY